MGKTIKNPCKICCKTVSKKTGLQCQGACKRWVHYCCLNYSPGKIRDIKTGIINVTCPCPDCKDIELEPEYSCSNVRCPSNSPLTCNDVACSANNFMKKQKSRSCETFYENNFEDEQPRSKLISDKEVQPSNGILRLTQKMCNKSDPSFSTIEHMYQTVGQLSMQVQELMGKMKQVVEENRRLKSAGQARPKPCFCPNINFN